MGLTMIHRSIVLRPTGEPAAAALLRVLASHSALRRLAQQARAHARKRWDVEQHVGIGGVGERAMTLPGSDAAADVLDRLAKPDLLEIVTVVAQIAEVVSP